MATKKNAKKAAAKKPRVKTLNLKRETIKEVNSRDKEKVRGGGGLSGTIETGIRQ